MKKIILVIAVICAVAILGTGNVLAIEFTGKNSVRIAATQEHTAIDGAGMDMEMDSTTILLGVGFYPVSFLELRPVLIMGYNETDTDGDDSESKNLNGAIDVNFMIPVDGHNPIVPYAGINIGFMYYDSGDDDDTAISGGVQAGLKYFPIESVSIDLEGRFTRTEFDADDDYSTSDDTIDYDVTRIFVGLSYYF